MRNHLTILLTAILCFCATLSFAQTEISVRGIVYKKSTAERVSQVLVTNPRTHVVMVTDEVGVFTIKAIIGDTLLITKTDYATQKQGVANSNDIAIFLQPVIHLSEVKIVGQTKQQELNSIMGDYRKKGTFYNGKPPLLSSVLGSPLTGLYELFGKTPNQAKRFAAYSKQELEAAADKRKYNKELVKRITNLSDEEVEKFMHSYTPLHEDLVKWNDYEVISYIKESLVSYKENGAVKLQKLY